MRTRPVSIVAYAFAFIAAGLSLPAAADAQTFNCTFLAHLDSLPGDGNDVCGYTDPETGREYALIGTFFGTGVYNVTAPDSAYLTGFIPGAGSDWRDFAQYRNYVYAGSEGGGGIQIIDMANPEAPVLAATYTGGELARSHSITTDTLTAKLYVNGAGAPNPGMVILSIANPTAPLELGRFRLPPAPYVHDSTARNDTVWVSCINVGREMVLDASDPTAIDTIASFLTEKRATHNSWPSDDRKYLYVTDEVQGGRMTIWDMSDLGAPIQVAGFTAEGGGDAHNVYLRGDYAFIAHYTAGLQILDVSIPTRPVHVGGFDTYQGFGLFNGAWSAHPFTGSGNIYIGDIESGLFVVSFNGARGGGLTGTVTESLTGDPLEGVEIRSTITNGPTYTAVTDLAGHYELPLVAGTRTLTATRLGLVPTTFQVVVPPGPNTSHDFSLEDNTATLELPDPAPIRIDVFAGETAEGHLLIKNGGGGLLTFSITDETELSSVLPGKRPRPPLLKIVDDPAGDAIRFDTSGVHTADLATVRGATEGDSLFIRVEFHGGLPESVVVAIELDVDQNPATGFPILGSVGLLPADDLGGELLLLWDLAGRFIPGDTPTARGAILFTSSFSVVGQLQGEADASGATIGFARGDVSDEDGSLNLAVASMVATYGPGFPPFSPLNADAGPDVGHVILGTEVIDAPWLSVLPDTGSLRGSESYAVAIRADARSFAVDTTLAATLVIETNVASQPFARVPVEIRIARPDHVAPEVTVAFLQNPILPQGIELVATANEPLAGPPTVSVGGRSIPVTGEADAARPVFRGSTALGDGGQITLALAATDTAGNLRQASETFVAFPTPAKGPIVVQDAGKTLTFEAAEGALRAGTMLILREIDPVAAAVTAAEGAKHSESGLSPIVSIGPGGASLAGAASVAFAIDAGASGTIHELVDGRWMPLATFVSEDGQRLWAAVDRLGVYQVRASGSSPPVALPASSRIDRAFPNPTRGDATIAYTLSRPGAAGLTVFDLSGRRVRSVASGWQAAGSHLAAWDGRNDRGEQTAAGVYVLRLETPDGVRTRKLAVIR